MPGFILHLLHGQMILQQSKLFHFSESEQNQFKAGLLIPDSVNGQEKQLSHFFSSEQKYKILQVPDLNDFLERYANHMNNPFVVGYAAHLYLDKAFFSDYFLNYVRFLDKEGQATLDENSVESVLLLKTQKKITTKELFSEQYLYGDYTKMNQYLVNKYLIVPPSPRIADNPIIEVDPQNLSHLLSDLNQYLHTPISTDYTLSVFSVDTIETSLKEYASGFLEWREKSY